MIFGGWVTKALGALAALAGFLMLLFKSQRDKARAEKTAFEHEVQAKTDKARIEQRTRTDVARTEARKEADKAQEQVDEQIEDIDAGERPIGNFGDPRLRGENTR